MMKLCQLPTIYYTIPLSSILRELFFRPPFPACATHYQLGWKQEAYAF